MASAITEIASLPLRADISLTSGEGKTILQDTLNTIAKQVGLKSLYWGRKIEDPDFLQIVVNWADITNHTTFQDSLLYPAFLERVGGILSGAPSLSHVKLPDSGTPFDAHITECVEAYLPASYDEDAYFKARWTAFQHEVNNHLHSDVSLGMSGGFSIEHQRHTGVDGSVDCKLFTAFTGWSCKEAHIADHTTEKYRKMVGLAGVGVIEVKVYHVEFVRHV